MSSVFISNVDDYISPSMACVNPLFAEKTETKSTTNGETKENGNGSNAGQIQSSSSLSEAAATSKQGVVTRTRRRPRQRIKGGSGATGSVSITPASDTNMSSTTANTDVVEKETARVTMADCLACSGCVTTAETVLVEQHSLSKLKELAADVAESNQSLSTTTTTPKMMAFTLSPVVFADLQRHIGLDCSPLAFRRKLTTFLQRSCHGTVVLDGALPLQWSLTESAKEFCRIYRQERSSTVTDGAAHSVRPLFSSTCPAFVCLVEKSHAKLVPRLATTKSPMAIAGAYLKQVLRHQNATSAHDILHVAVMPCHDKKLEASRKDFIDQQTNAPDVNLVVTTRELMDLLEEHCGTNDPVLVRQYLNDLPESSVMDNDNVLHNNNDNGNRTTITGLLSTGFSVDAMDCSDSCENDSSSTSFYAHSSGGYADFVFRYAAKDLFGVCIDGPLPWKPVETATIKHRSARTANRKKEYHAVSLYRHSDGTFSTKPSNDTASTPVLRFATAYGMQTLQRVLQSHEPSKTQHDYIEAMACPSGCANGGGQIRMRAREVPTETRERVRRTNQRLEQTRSIRAPGSDDMVPPVEMQTSFHVVAPLQLTMGAAAGVAVQDTQW